MNYVQYLSIKQILYVLGETSQIAIHQKTGTLYHQKIFNILAFGQAMEKFNKTKEQK